jgi:acyl-CoA synthetase (NDP forming)/GNAT superfamily N-acetyltransferase
VRTLEPTPSDVLLADGSIARIRPLTEADIVTAGAMLDRVGDDNLYLRFFTGGRSSARAYLETILKPGRPGMALAAFGVAGELAAIGEFIPIPGGDSAEIAFLVDDARHHTGLGTLLLEHLAADARSRGIRRFVAIVLSRNQAMLHVLANAGFTATRRTEHGEVTVELDLTITPALLNRVDERDRTSGTASIAHILAPASVAVIGAGRNPGGVGHRILANIISGGFTGPIHPVNPHGGDLLGHPISRTVPELPYGLDLAVIATPAPTVLELARQCAERGVRTLVVITAGFGETGSRTGEAELRAICRAAGMRLVGPNCLGVLATRTPLNATFLTSAPKPGRVGVATQSGAVGAILIDELDRLGPGVSDFVSLGNKADVSGNDLLRYWQHDQATDVIALYLESFGNPRAFARIAARIGRTKPVVVLKAGRSAAGSRAVGSHTAAAASPEVAVAALLRRAGVIRATDLREFIDVIRLLGHQPLPAGRRVAIVGNSGGPGALAADDCAAAGLIVPELTPGTRATLRDLLGPAAAVANPVDLTADGTAERYVAALWLVLADPGVDSVIAVYTPPFGSGLAATRRAIAEAAEGTTKPVVACLLGTDDLIEGVRPVPAYAFPEQAATALGLVTAYAEHRRHPEDLPAVPAGLRAEPARLLVAADLATYPEGRWLDPVTATRLLRCYGIEPVESITADGPETAVEAATKIGYPIALKAVGPIHKSDHGGVRLGLETPGQVRDAAHAMAAALGDRLTGVLVQPMAGDGVEMIIGATEQSTFGPLVMLGMGGVTTELLGDRVFRTAPLTGTDAAEMVESLRCAPLFHGYRGSPPVDIEAVKDLLVRIGHLADDLPEVAELDLNPVIVTSGAPAIVDVKIRIAPAVAPASPLRRALRS